VLVHSRPAAPATMLDRSDARGPRLSYSPVHVAGGCAVGAGGSAAELQRELVTLGAGRPSARHDEGLARAETVDAIVDNQGVPETGLTTVMRWTPMLRSPGQH